MPIDHLLHPATAQGGVTFVASTFVPDYEKSRDRVAFKIVPLFFSCLHVNTYLTSSKVCHGQGHRSVHQQQCLIT